MMQQAFQSSCINQVQAMVFQIQVMKDALRHHASVLRCQTASKPTAEWPLLS